MSSKNYSLRRRLLISASALLLAFLGLMGLALNNAFKQSVLSNAEDALRNQVLLLMANVDVIDGQIVVPPILSEARLSQTDSSLFAQISRPSLGAVWQSESLLGMTLPEFESSQGEFRFIEKVEWSDSERMYAMSLGVIWETEQGDLPFTVQIAEKSRAYEARIVRYQRQIGFWLAGLAASLLALLLALLSWALNPLVRVTTQVAQIERGERRRFDEDYPNEVSRLTQNLNQLLSFEEQRITQHKDVLGNLAHSLKTPIAVLKGLRYRDENKQEAEQQLGSMQNIIDYQLQSASAVGRRRFAKPIEIRDATQQIVDSLNKLHKAKVLHVSIDIAPETVFYGDLGDWMELAGNLLDNAYKWASSSVSVQVVNRSMNSNRSSLHLEVCDDGDGINNELKATILQRGVRLDSTTPGHGLGLHIVKGIVEAYGGEISISDLEPQGSCFSVSLS